MVLKRAIPPSAASPGARPPAPLSPVLLRRFRVHGFLGSGAEGRVYLAEERTHPGSRLSLKVLHQPLGVSPAALRLNLSALARIDHPNVARVVDFDVDHDRRLAWVAREYVPGEDLGRFAARRDQPVDVTLPRLLESVARALLQFHERGLVHGDIRPANILCSHTREGPMLKLIDGGTPAPASPEDGRTTLGHRRRQDLRFAGAAFYAAATGRAANRRIAPRTLNPRLPPWIDRLILRLLVPYAPDGIGTAGVFLEEILRRSRTGARRRGLEITLTKPPVVGRDPELATLRRAVDRVADGALRSPVVLIDGESGSGKTALLREAQVYARARGIDFLLARAPAGDGLPYEPLVQITQAAAALHGWRDPSQAARPRTPAELVAAVSKLLGRAALRRPCAIAVDDAQTVPSQGRETLRRIAEAVRAGPAGGRVLFLVSARGADHARRWSDDLRALKHDAMPLGDIGPEAAASLVRLAIGLPPEDAFVRRLHSICGGNPGQILTSLELLRPRLRREGAEVGLASLDDIPAPGDAEADARALLAQVEPSLLPSARALSVHPGFLRESVCRDVLGGATSDDVLRALAAAGVLRRVSLHTYEWPSAFLRRELHAGVPSDRRRKLHDAFSRAGALWMRKGTLDHHLFQAYHLARSTQPGRAHPHALASARLLAAVFRYGEAADYYELALRLLPPRRPAAVIDILGALQAACRKGGLNRRGKSVSLELLRRRRSLGQYANAAHFVRLVDGPGAAVSLIDAGLRSACRRSPGGLALLHSKRAAALALGGRHASAEAAARRAESYLSEGRSPSVAADVFLDLGSVHYLRGDLPLATEYYRAALRLTRRARDAAREALLCDNLALTLRSRLDLRGALGHARRALAIKTRRGLVLDAAVTRMILGALHDDAGRRDAARAEILQARDVFRSRGDEIRQAWASYGVASIHLAGEEYADALEWLDRTLEEAPKDGRNGLILAALAGKVQAFLGTGDLEQADACCRLGAAELHAGAGFEARMAWLRARVLHARARGDLRSAGRLLKGAERELLRTEARAWRLQFEILSLETGLAAGRPDALAEQAERLVAVLEPTELAPLRGEALLAAAEAQARAGNSRRAGALLGRLAPLLALQPPPSWRIRAGLLRARLAPSASARIRAATEALHAAARHELRPLCHAAALELARSYEAQEDYSSALRYYQEAGDYAGSRSA